MKRNDKWTEEEDRILIDNYSKFGNAYCESILNRTSVAIKGRVKKLKLKYSNIKEIYLEDNFIKIVKDSRTISDILDKLGLRKAGGNYEVIKKYLTLYKIDTSHFETAEDRYKNMINRFVRQPIERYLVVNSDASRNNLKKRLLEEGYLKPICCLCDQDENWNGMKISLILDHINGVHNDNRLENLRIVCPNCNAGLDTFAGKNKFKDEHIEYNKVTKNNDNIEYITIYKSGQQKTKHFCICGNKILKKSKICITCSRFKKRKVGRPTYEELLKLKETKSNIEIGKLYDVSEASIRKWIKQTKTN